MHDRYARIQALLCAHFTPEYLQIENESHRHNVPENAQTHFKVSLVSSIFKGLSRVERHRSIHKLLDEEFASGLHALSLQLFTPEEWERKQSKTKASPACKGGFSK